MTQVCIIEDDEGTREAVRDLLVDAGYDVITAANGLIGHALIRTSPERLVVALDHKLPALDGCDLLEIVAQDEELRARHTFIFMTASPKRALEDCEAALDELDVPLVPKPFDIDDLVEAVRQAEQRLVPVAEAAGDLPAEAD
jgi:two-component system cell cycle response regulator DivK